MSSEWRAGYKTRIPAPSANSQFCSRSIHATQTHPQAVEMGAAAPPEQLKPSLPGKLTLEAWSQGFMVGGLVIMCGITLANMRRGVLLHKLILIEVGNVPEFRTSDPPR